MERQWWNGIREDCNTPTMSASLFLSLVASSLLDLLFLFNGLLLFGYRLCVLVRSTRDEQINDENGKRPFFFSLFFSISCLLKLEASYRPWMRMSHICRNSVPSYRIPCRTFFDASFSIWSNQRRCLHPRVLTSYQRTLSLMHPPHPPMRCVK